jgi:hypothetical protein
MSNISVICAISGGSFPRHGPARHQPPGALSFGIAEPALLEAGDACDAFDIG